MPWGMGRDEGVLVEGEVGAGTKRSLSPDPLPGKQPSWVWGLVPALLRGAEKAAVRAKPRFPSPKCSLSFALAQPCTTEPPFCSLLKTPPAGRVPSPSCLFPAGSFGCSRAALGARHPACREPAPRPSCGPAAPPSPQTPRLQELPLPSEPQQGPEGKTLGKTSRADIHNQPGMFSLNIPQTSE